MTARPRAGGRVLAATAAVLVALAACGDGGPGSSTPPPSPTAARPALRPPTPETASGFVAFGDAGGGPGQIEVARAMERWVARGHRVDALVAAGDNVYDFGEPWKFDDQLVEPYRRLRRGRPLWVTLGNHDVARGYGNRQLAFLGLPDLPYAKRLPGVELLFLDGNRPSREQADWLEARLSRPGPRFRVAVFHQPPYSCGRHGSVLAVREVWTPVLTRHRVALVISAHDHLYQRFTSPSGVTYVVTGGGGNGLYAPRSPCRAGLPLRAAAVAYHFVGVEVRGRTMTVTAVGADDRVLDRLTITR